MTFGRGPFLASLCIFALACVTGWAVEAARGPLSRPVESGGVGADGPFYIGLAKAMAAGNGYVLERSPWPDSPHLGRLPLWPWILTVPCWLFPGINEYAILRGTSILLHGFVAMLLLLLTYKLWRDLPAAFLAGSLFTFYPVSLALMDSGLSEHSFLLAVTSGMLLLFAANKWSQAVGAILLGLSVLARSNAVLLPVLVVLAGLLWRPEWMRHWRRALVLSALFFLPVSLWMLRNFAVSGSVLINALEGETLYGSNNAVVAENLEEWGYWIFPDRIPGETPKQQLGRHISEAELNAYYRQKGLDYIRRNWFSLPRLLLGKFIRGFVPVPWAPRASSYVAFLLRGVLYAAGIWAVRRGVITHEFFGLLIAALLVDALLTTLIFYGSFRFTFCIEPYLLCCVSVMLVRFWRDWRLNA